MSRSDRPSSEERARWAAWRQGAFGDPYMVWHDGPDLAALGPEVRADPPGVDHLLTLGLRDRDPLAAQSVGWLRAAGLPCPDALGLLPLTVKGSPAGYRLRAAEALFSITGAPEWEEEIEGVLRGAGWSARLDAAMLLGRLTPIPRAIDALEAAVGDPEYLVRYHAANSLLAYAGATPDIASHPLFANITAKGRGFHARRARREAATVLAQAAREALA